MEAPCPPAVEHRLPRRLHRARPPPGLQIRYVTVGGAYVDVVGSGDYRYDNHWSCHGCRDTSRLPEKADLDVMRESAHEHASVCRAIPLT